MAASTGWWDPTRLAAMNRSWQEVGISQGREFVNLDESGRYQGDDGRTVIFYCDVVRFGTALAGILPAGCEDYSRNDLRDPPGHPHVRPYGHPGEKQIVI